MSDSTESDRTESDRTESDSTESDRRKLDPVRFDPAELRARLDPIQYEVTQNAGTERPFSGVYWNTTTTGTYHCVVCDLELFSSTTKFDAGCGWPSFYEALDPARVAMIEDRSHGMVRVEVRCARCDAHLGHVFPDGPAPTGDRYCMNSASLRLDPQEA